MPGPVFLRGETVTLHALAPDDAAFLADVINDPAVRRWLSAATPNPEAAEREWIEEVANSDSEVHLLVCADGEPVGIAGLNEVDPVTGAAALGYFLAEEAWGNGYATDAARTLVDHAFDAMRLHRVYAEVLVDNAASRRVLEKVGFRHEGTKRDHWFVDGDYVDVELYGLLADEYERS